MSSRAGLTEFAAPAPLIAVAVMAINDFWGKPTFHNWLTGKLSDVAICFFLPLFVAALLEPFAPARKRARVFIGAAVTATLFTAINVSQPLADLFCAGLTVIGRPLGFDQFRAIADPTDLLALPMVLLAVMYGLAELRRARSSSFTPGVA